MRQPDRSRQPARGNVMELVWQVGPPLEGQPPVTKQVGAGQERGLCDVVVGTDTGLTPR
ncbi:MAG: hypothetical protein QOI74_1417 [Micromonosporaceae bacterium]|jgi:hypothetical protein|nr:hypothetical protein [Micromonosporaceae bacterium]